MELEVLDRPKTQQKQLARLLTPSGQHNLSVVAMPGESVQQLVDRAIPKEMQGYIVAFNHGMKITELENFYIREEDSILLTVVPQGGGGGGGKGGILGAVLMVAVMVAAPYAAAALSTSMGLGLAAGSMGMSALTMGIGLVGMMAVSALIPPPSTNQTGGGYNSQAASPTYSLSGQSNQSKRYGTVARIYGRHKYYPMLASNPLISNLGTESRISALYDFGLGNIKISDLKIGDSDASSLSPELHYHTNSLVTNTAYLSRRVGYDQFAYVPKKDVDIFLRTKPDTVSFTLDLSFQRGLTRFDEKGNLAEHGIDVAVAYRLVGTTTWNYLNSSSFFGATFSGHPPPNPDVTIKGALNSPFTVGIAVDSLPPGDYEIWFAKKSPDSTDNRVVESFSISLLKSFKAGSVVNLGKRHTMLEMRILATDKVSGTVQNLSAVCTSILRTTTDGVTFVDQETSNPAWIALDILTGEGNPKPLPDNLIDWPSFIKLAKYCDDNKIYANFVVDYVTTIQDLLNSVLGVAHSSMRFTSSGKYGVLIDEEQTIPRQIITPTNSWGFSGTRTFTDPPHAFLVTFINPDINWQKDERIVYADGHDETNATKFETLQTFGITNKDQAWKYGRYMLAQGIHRSETFTVTMDVENLVVQRGDLVHVAHDVPRIGGMACRVVSITGTDITVDNDLGVIPNGYSVRLDDGTVRTGRITASLDGHRFTLDNATGIHADDVIVLGQVDRVVGKYLVQSINPGANLTAELQMVKYVPEVYQADKGAIPPWDPEISIDMINTTDLKIVDLKALQELIHIDRYPYAKIDLNWGITGFNYGHSEINLWVDGKPIHVGDSSSMSYEHLIEVLKNPMLMNKKIEFEVVPYNGSGIQGQSAKIDIIPMPDDKIPAAVTGFSVNVQDMLVEIFWDKHEDDDIEYFEVRYSPNVDGIWSASQLIGILPHNSMKTSAGARTGRYFIQAVDTSGNRSIIMSQRTTIEHLPNINQVKVVNDMPLGWRGTLAGFERTSGGTIQSDGAYGSVVPESWYYFNDFVKFDDIYEVRVSSKIQAHGKHKDDIMVKWTPLTSVKPLSRASSSDWNAQLMVRSSNDATVMASWVPLASAKPLTAMTNTWSNWRAVNVSDETAKVMQFAIKAESWNPDVKVVLDDGRVEIDASDWIWRSQDHKVPASLTRILFDPPFMDIPVVAITIDGTSKAEKYEMTNKTRHGFDLKLLDAGGTIVAGQVDIAALGQGRQRTKSI